MPSEQQSRADQFLAHIFDPKARAVKESRLRHRRVVDASLAGWLTDGRQKRRTPPPPGVCEDCWRERLSDSRPGTCYSIGGCKLVTWCPDCAERARPILNIDLVPFSL
jgi:hypothetical protein